MNQIVGAAVPSGENAAMVSNVVGYVESEGRVEVRNNVVNVNVGLNRLAKAVEKLADGFNALAEAVAGCCSGLVRLLPNEWHLSFSIGRCSNTSAS